MIIVSNLISATASPEVISALIALGGVVVSVSINLMVGFWQRKYNYNHLHAEIVSKSRNTWLNEMRDFISTMITEARIQVINSTGTKHLQKYYKAREQVVLRLNLNEEDHRNLQVNISKLDNAIINNNGTTNNGTANKGVPNLDPIIKDIEEITQKILKEEWEKVKREAKGKGEEL